MHDRLGVAEEELAGLCHRDRARAARALHEPLPDDALECRDLLAHRRLGVAELGGGTPERAGARDRLERGQVAHLDAEPALARRLLRRSISFANGCHEKPDLC